MASAVSGIRKLKRKDIPRIEADLYSETGLNDLVVASIYFLQKHGIDATTEEIVSICFRLFPQKFCLKNHPRWPDSALVIRRLTDCREKGLLHGSLHDGFTLKFKGQKLGERTALALGLVKPAPVTKKKKQLPAKKKVVAKAIKPKVQKEKRRQARKKVVKQVTATAKKIVKTPKVKKQIQKKTVIQKPVLKKRPLKKKEQTPVPVVATPVKVVKPVQEKKKATAPPLTKLQKIQPEAARPLKEERPVTATKEEKAKAVQIVRMMDRSDAYRHFSKNGKGSRISEFDFRNMLLATMESSSETLIRNVDLFKRSANIQGRQDLVTFLSYCETNFADLLKPSAKKKKK